MLFRDNYDFLSNFYECSVKWGGITYRNTEAAFQASKCTGINEHMRVQFTTLTGSEAKKLGRKVPIRMDWEQVKVGIMHDIVYCKFKQNLDLAKKLIDTGNIEIAEDNTWGDRFWGKCKGIGKNVLGIILMQVREELKELFSEAEIITFREKEKSDESI